MVGLFLYHLCKGDKVFYAHLFRSQPGILFRNISGQRLQAVAKGLAALVEGCFDHLLADDRCKWP